MKKQAKKIFFFIVLLSFFASSCTEDGPNAPSPEQNADNIRDYISKLSYNSEEMLNYQQTNGLASEKAVVSENADTADDADYTTICKFTTYNLKKNFDNVAILRPTNGIVWPGALVKGNQSLMDGVPETIGIERAPITISVNLPGIGQNGVRTIKIPAASSVQAAIDSSLDWWNNNAYEEGYVNAANSSYNLTTSYSSKQLALDVDLNVEWASGSVSAQFNYSSDDEKNVVMMVYKQAFYDVIFDTPTSPENMFADNVSLNDVKSVINNAAAPAYIQSVTYGRIIMFRMETSNSHKSIDVEGALNYAGGASVDASLKVTYDEILKSSSINLVVIGGNAEVATEAICSPGEDPNAILEKVQGVIKGKNAVYSKENPGVPIGYSVFYLKDNSLAKLGFTTEYTTNECYLTKKSDLITVYLHQFYVIQDCDGPPLGKGNFRYEVRIFNNDGVIGGYSSDIKEYGDGWAENINIPKSFSLPRLEGAYFKIQLICDEIDYDLFGNPYFDSRMNARSNVIRFEYNNGGWNGVYNYNSPAAYDLVVGEENCKVRLAYSISVE
jgi:thiol-activated cytolysin